MTVGRLVADSGHLNGPCEARPECFNISDLDNCACFDFNEEGPPSVRPTKVQSAWLYGSRRRRDMTRMRSVRRQASRGCTGT